MDSSFSLNESKGLLPTVTANSHTAKGDVSGVQTLEPMKSGLIDVTKSLFEYEKSDGVTAIANQEPENSTAQGKRSNPSMPAGSCTSNHEIRFHLPGQGPVVHSVLEVAPTFGKSRQSPLQI